MTHHETGDRRGGALRTARRLGRAVGRMLDGPSSPRWAVVPYPRSGRVPGHPLACDAARWRH
ncbi:hypothetical protein FHX44_111699 [Pseudonocardia hierapolitana]|uniref:Uncharacterized protein n=1 Tax=Pseudonocardia hierapolitana TaxID=1128676 RepID=A0A561SLR2_9PSEU|nr:hypothetical protein [Pseudonocardia hierapolitana]TWF75814.1 hypothetical protein FHX44_111699 [Pseudonocardia hierapolitana]